MLKASGPMRIQASGSLPRRARRRRAELERGRLADAHFRPSGHGPCGGR